MKKRPRITRGISTNKQTITVEKYPAKNIEEDYVLKRKANGWKSNEAHRGRMYFNTTLDLSDIDWDEIQPDFKTGSKRAYLYLATTRDGELSLNRFGDEICRVKLSKGNNSAAQQTYMDGYLFKDAIHDVIDIRKVPVTIVVHKKKPAKSLCSAFINIAHEYQINGATLGAFRDRTQEVFEKMTKKKNNQ